MIFTRANSDDEMLLCADLQLLDRINPSLLSTQQTDYRKVDQ
jgi:hypothetical protein